MSDLRETIDKAIAAVRDSTYRPCYHVVHPPPSGMRWELTEDIDAAGVVVLRCASLCGWAAFAKAVPQ